jgi:hypothetical protein
LRFPWQQGLGAGDELEALQTDVMRFIAILGLCLVAIFSLVNGVQQEQASAQLSLEPAPKEQREQESVQQEPVPVPTKPRDPMPAAPEAPADQADSRETSTQDEEQQGFTLEFESVDALASLLAAGRLQLFAVVADEFHRYHPDGVYRQVEAPASYYEMDAATVPRRLRLQGESLFSGAVGWGVTLPAAAAVEVQRLVSTETRGKLLIGADASVRLERGESHLK